MNNVEIYNDFVETAGKEVYSVALTVREKLLVRMAINHTMLLLQDEISQQAAMDSERGELD